MPSVAAFLHPQKKATERTATTIITEALMYAPKDTSGAALGVQEAYLT